MISVGVPELLSGSEDIVIVATSSEVTDILNGRLGDNSHGLSGEKGLVASNQRVRKSEQPYNGIIRNNLIGEVLKEYLRFLLIDV